MACVTLTFLTRFCVLAVLAGQLWACAPGRSGYRRRAPRRLTPLVIKQFVPNTGEQNEIAAGPAVGAISRTSVSFRKLVPNYNGDIRFLDDEGTGADRIMTQRCRDKLDTLAVSVMMQWPGVKLRVIESWDEYSHHRSGSLHYEGRAVDITTDDRNQAKYGMLARLAVEAGFDWVYYESKKHIHCSVKPDSANERKTAGCFERSSIVQTRTGSKTMAELRVNDEVLSYNSDSGRLEFSPVLTFLDRDLSRKEHFVKIKTDSGEQLVLTRYHLVYRQEYDGQPSVTYASRILPGDKILTVRKSHASGNGSLDNSADNAAHAQDSLMTTKVLAVHHVRSRGVYAPLTATGNIVVNGVVASCYALVNDHQLAHRAFAPLRALYPPLRWARRWMSWIRDRLRAGPSAGSRSEELSLPRSPLSPTKAKASQANDTAKLTEALTASQTAPSGGDDLQDEVKAIDEDNQDDPVDAYTASFRGIHWYAAILYYVFQSGLTSYMP